MVLISQAEAAAILSLAPLQCRLNRGLRALLSLKDGTAAREELLDPMHAEPATTRSRRTSGHLLTLGQVADTLRIRPRAVVDYVNRGELEGQRVGRSWRFTQDAIDRFFEEPPAWRATDFLSYGE